MPALPVQVTRVNKRDIGLQCIESCEEIGAPPEDGLNFTAGNSDAPQNFAKQDESDEFGELA